MVETYPTEWIDEPFLDPTIIDADARYCEFDFARWTNRTIKSIRNERYRGGGPAYVKGRIRRRKTKIWRSGAPVWLKRKPRRS